ncbi:hypothetical protein RJ640_002505 [Escallonia rubra]|uniref:Uncharacterized protein n=1 Tax=Escallonia rubra TaxID=112253 RepID=A0AA88RU98_9ASTE|nr:hypothetical protein RJ640_002505 [Escallonia rubra]
MTGNISLFTSIDLKEGGNVTFGDNSQGRIKGKGTIGKEPHSIENVLYVEGLKHNLLSISQFSDKDFKVIFEASQCTILSLKNNETILVGSRDNNVYSIQLNDLANQDVKCLSAISETSWLWHRRLGHMHMEHLKDISSKELVRGLPKIKFEKDKVCDACQMGKQKKVSHKPKKMVSTSRPLQLLHMDLFGPIPTTSLGGKSYCFVIVDDFSRYTWTFFLATKDESLNVFTSFAKRVQNQKDDMDNDLRTLDISETPQDNSKEIDLGEQPSSSQGGNEEAINDASNLDDSQELPKDWTYKKDHPSDQILGNPSSGEFEMSMMGELTFFLVLQIKQSNDGIFVNQAKYTKELLKRFDMEASNAFDTPMSSSLKLDKDEKGKDVDIKRYRGMIGSLIYLTASRPDIMFSVCLCARFQACPKESHLIAVKRILRYLKGTHDLGLWFPRNTSFFDLIGYSDADYAGCKTERKSTSGGCQFLGHSLVSWSSKKQNSVALSTTEAEYMAVGACCAQILWMKQTLLDFGLKYDHIPILCDNTSAIDLTKNPIQHSRTKHIEIKHHFIRDHVQKGDIVLDFVDTNHQLADIFTKPLDSKRFSALRRELGMSSPM